MGVAEKLVEELEAEEVEAEVHEQVGEVLAEHRHRHHQGKRRSA